MTEADLFTKLASGGPVLLLCGVLYFGLKAFISAWASEAEKSRESAEKRDQSFAESIKLMAESVAKLAETVSANTEAVRKCQNNAPRIQT